MSEKKHLKNYQRIKQTMVAYPMENINIETMNKRVTMVLAAKGMRIKY